MQSKNCIFHFLCSNSQMVLHYLVVRHFISCQILPIKPTWWEGGSLGLEEVIFTMTTPINGHRRTVKIGCKRGSGSQKKRIILHEIMVDIPDYPSLATIYKSDNPHFTQLHSDMEWTIWTWGRTSMEATRMLLLFMEAVSWWQCIIFSWTTMCAAYLQM